MLVLVLVLEVDQIDCTIASEAAATQFWSVLVSPRPYFQLPLSTHLEMCIAPALARPLPGGVWPCQRNFAKCSQNFEKAPTCAFSLFVESDILEKILKAKLPVNN